MARIARGDEDALRALFERHGPAVLGVARSVVRDHGRAEEVLHDTFLRAARRAATYRPSASGAAPWLLAIARNASVDVIRRRRREPQVACTSAAFKSLADSRSSASDRVARTELGLAARSAVRKLPSGQRRALELAYFGGLTHAEVSRRLAVPLGTAKTWLRLGLAALRARLAAFADADTLAAA
jgi:RNA polymerase sigma-70 factor (ECF subfamily)